MPKPRTGLEEDRRADGSFTQNLNGAMLTAPAPYSITAIASDYRSLPTSITRAGVATQYRYSSDGQRYFKKTGTSANIRDFIK